MINKSKSLRILSLGFVAAGFALLCADATPIFGQNRDPFDKPGWAKPKTAAPLRTGSTGPKAEKPVKAGPPPVVAVGAPDINQRINFYKQTRLEAAENGQPIPKVTSVLTLDEMSIIGVFRTPRGYAAMVEAKPISLSYTIYPGEKFFDGQLVAIEENRLIFRKVTKMSNGKFIASVENKALRQYTDKEQIRGTAPIESQPVEKQPETAANILPSVENKNVQNVAPTIIISPLDEMNRQPVEKPKEAEKGKSAKKKGSEKNKTAGEKDADDAEKEKTAKKGKKPVRIAKNK
jgi:hypothetical protein